MDHFSLSPHKSSDGHKTEENVTIKLSKPTYSAPMTTKESVYSKRTRLSFSTSDRATKRVIAPYVRIVRRDKKVAKEETEDDNKQFRLYLQRKPSLLLRNLSAFLSDSVDLPSILHETVDVLKTVTKAAGVTLYMVDPAAGEIYQSPRNVISDRHKVNWKIEPGKTIAAYVAFIKEYVMVDDVLGDVRFPEGVAYTDETIKSVLCVPIVTSDDECYAIVELCRDVTQPVFGKEDLKIVIVVTGWMGAAIHQNQQRLALQKQQELNDYLLDLTKCYFADTVVMEKMISEVVSFAKVTLGAGRGSFYVIDKDSEELLADAFEEGDSGENKLHKKNLKVRFHQDGGIPGLVARTGQTVNIANAYEDPRFNKEVDEKTNFITRAVLCMPVMGMNGILGVVQVINKTTGLCFTTADENLLHTFSLYCALALHYSKLSSLMFKAEKTNKCFLDMLGFHMKPCQHDLKQFIAHPEVADIPDGFNEFAWYITPELYVYMPQLTLYMITEVVGEADINSVAMMQFILSVQISYRENPYHCFEHAFNVCHCMYNILRRNLDVFTPIEIKALIIAALCHDLDHKGFTNNFLLLTNDTLSELYEESYLENHHYLVTMTIIGKYKMFPDTTEAQFTELSKEIKELILATDLSAYFKCRSKLIQVWHEGGFDWSNLGHRSLLKAIMMTTADLSGQCKPYNTAKKITDCLYKEFYNQGDIEKGMGLYPLSMMDRDKQHMVPEDQVQFLMVVVIPCIELLLMSLPNTSDLLVECHPSHVTTPMTFLRAVSICKSSLLCISVSGSLGAVSQTEMQSKLDLHIDTARRNVIGVVRSLKDVWRQIIELTGQKSWRQGDSVVTEN